MEAETQHYLNEVKRVKNVSTEGELKVKAKRYLTHAERHNRTTELEQVEGMLSPTNFAVRSMSDEGKSMLARRRAALRKQLVEEAPPTQISGETKDALYKRQQELEADIKVGMLSHEEMRRNPAGAVDRHRKWERANKERILERANILRVLNPEDDSKDLTNIDLIRPSIARLDGTTTYMQDAQIPGVFAMTPQAKENWPLGEPKVDTALKQAERVEAQAELTNKSATQKTKERTPAQIAHSEKMKARFAAQRNAKGGQNA